MTWSARFEVIELEEGTETQIKVGDAIPAHGHFTS